MEDNTTGSIVPDTSEQGNINFNVLIIYAISLLTLLIIFGLSVIVFKKYRKSRSLNSQSNIRNTNSLCLQESALDIPTLASEDIFCNAGFQPSDLHNNPHSFSSGSYADTGSLHLFNDDAHFDTNGSTSQNNFSNEDNMHSTDDENGISCKHSNSINFSSGEETFHSCTTYERFSSSNNGHENSESGEEPIYHNVQNFNRCKLSRAEHLIQVKGGSSRRWKQTKCESKKGDRLSQSDEIEESFSNNENDGMVCDQRWCLTPVAIVHEPTNYNLDESALYRQVNSRNVLAKDTHETESHEVETDEIDHLQLPTSDSNDEQERNKTMDKHSSQIERSVRRRKPFQRIMRKQLSRSEEIDKPYSKNGNGGKPCMKDNHFSSFNNAVALHVSKNEDFDERASYSLSDGNNDLRDHTHGTILYEKETDDNNYLRTPVPGLTEDRNDVVEGHLSDIYMAPDGNEIADGYASDIYEITDGYEINSINIATSASHTIPDKSFSDKSPERKSKSMHSHNNHHKVRICQVPGPEPVSKEMTLYNTDIRNNPWNLNGHITERNGCRLWKENSDVTLSIPPNAVDVHTRISGSVILDIPELRHMFDLESEELIVAPAVEFQIENTDFLHKHACIQIPHCMRQNVDNMHVWCFSRDRSVQITYRDAIPGRGRKVPDPCSDDIFWTIKDLNTINVFTKHFSGFLCTACDKHVDIRDIRGYLFNTFGVLDGHTTLSLSFQLSGPLSRIADFEKSIISEMNKRHYNLVTKKKIAFDQRKEGCLLLSLEMAGSRSSDWQPVKRASGKHVYDEEQEVAIDQLLSCGNEHIIASENEWYLQYKSAVRQRCSMCVDVKHIVDKDTKPIQTTMHGELLPPPTYEYLTPGANNYNLEILQPRHIISQEPKESSILSDGSYT